MAVAAAVAARAVVAVAAAAVARAALVLVRAAVEAEAAMADSACIMRRRRTHRGHKCTGRTTRHR